MANVNDEVASKLHELLAKEFLARLTQGCCQACGRTPATVQELEAVRKFLTDNGVTAVAKTGTPIRRLVDNLPYTPDGDPETRVQRYA